ncbi:MULTISPECIES: hypothetical protein [unclassified Microcoleus]|uniref:tetratricopeptide repeat protein n=1 Tax=unclassified Microcoleus TaxID=2642155 RepID=UPI0025E855C3|nr:MULTISPECIES: hypothetical protein [unclassified Microcoleus]
MFQFPIKSPEIIFGSNLAFFLVSYPDSATPHILPPGAYLQSVPAAVWLGESYRVQGDVGASKRCWEVACEGCQELRAFNPAVADCWLGRALVGLGDRLGAIEAYESPLRQELLYPNRGEVEKIVKRLKSKRRKGCGG